MISQADGYDVCGIASWRNVIPNYQINGAVTEINSECYAALKEAAALASAMGRAGDETEFAQAARDLEVAINYRLTNRDNGLYYHKYDSEGNAHADVTSDEIFPVLFGVAPKHIERRIISRLMADDFMTSAGLCTCSRRSPDYEPSTLIGLRGGVWPGAAFWYAIAAAATNPEFMVRALHAGSSTISWIPGRTIRFRDNFRSGSMENRW